MAPSSEFRFTAPVWEWDGQAAWHFVSLPEEVTDDIDERYGHRSAGFGSIKVEVTIGSSTWRTSVFPDTKRATFILPIKKAVRRAEGLVDGAPADVRLRVVIDE